MAFTLDHFHALQSPSLTAPVAQTVLQHINSPLELNYLVSSCNILLETRVHVPPHLPDGPPSQWAFTRRDYWCISWKTYSLFLSESQPPIPKKNHVSPTPGVSRAPTVTTWSVLAHHFLAWHPKISHIWIVLVMRMCLLIPMHHAHWVAPSVPCTLYCLSFWISLLASLSQCRKRRPQMYHQAKRRSVQSVRSNITFVVLALM